MQLIDNTYFSGDLFLPGKGDTVTASTISQAVNQNEPKYLALVLGEPLYAAFTAGLLVDPIDQKWLNIRDGANFVQHGYTYRWNGFLNQSKRSPIANYTYYWYMRNGASISTGSGEVMPATENGTRNASTDKQTKAWNDMVKMNADLFAFLKANELVYPEWSTQHYRCNAQARDLFCTINRISV